jgi:hypothetical protein
VITRWLQPAIDASTRHKTRRRDSSDHAHTILVDLRRFQETAEGAGNATNL